MNKVFCFDSSFNSNIPNRFTAIYSSNIQTFNSLNSKIHGLTRIPDWICNHMPSKVWLLIHAVIESTPFSINGVSICSSHKVSLMKNNTLTLSAGKSFGTFCKHTAVTKWKHCSVINIRQHWFRQYLVARVKKVTLGVLPIRPLGTNFNEVWIKRHKHYV